jgi:hypothetical protein
MCHHTLHLCHNMSPHPTPLSQCVATPYTSIIMCHHTLHLYHNVSPHPTPLSQCVTTAYTSITMCHHTLHLYHNVSPHPPPLSCVTTPYTSITMCHHSLHLYHNVSPHPAPLSRGGAFCWGQYVSPITANLCDKLFLGTAKFPVSLPSHIDLSPVSLALSVACYP